MAIEKVDIVQGDTSVTVAPGRGGMATRFSVGDRDVFYLDQATLEDETRNVRGGSPVLFPSPGKLEGDHWSHDGRSGALEQHGFARKLAWKIDAEAADSITLSIDATSATRASYPWDFSVELRYSVRPRTLRIEQRVTNRGDGRMPFGFGFHPYFAVSQARKATVELPTPATRAWDNVAKKEIALAGIDLTQKEVDLHLLDHGSTTMSLGDVEVRGSPEYTQWVVWTLAGKDFVCVEPWTCPGNALNSGDRLIELERDESRSMWMEVVLRG